MTRVTTAVILTLLLSSASLSAPHAPAANSSGKPAQTKPASSKPQASTKVITGISVTQMPTASQPVRIHLALSRPSDVALSILLHVTDPTAPDPFGWPGRIAKVIRISGASAGPLQMPWDGRDDQDRDVLSSSPYITVKAAAGADRASICFKPVLEPPAGQTLMLIPVHSGNVFAPGELIQLAAQVTNVADRTAKVTATAVPSGQISTSTEPCPGGAATVLLSLGRTTTPGTRKITASLTVAAKRTAAASTSVTVAGPAPLPRSAEPVFGLVGLANPALAQAVGAGLWVDCRHWWENPDLRGPSQPAPDAPDAVVSDANKRGLLLVGSVPSGPDPSASLRAAAAHFIRRVSGWLLPSDASSPVLARLCADVKLVHKDALAVSPMLQTEEAEAFVRTNPPVDAVLFHSTCDGTTAQRLAAVRDAEAPGKELWAVVSGSSTISHSDALRGAVLNLVGGADRVLWHGPGALIGGDGSAGPGLAGCAFASQLLTGAEYAGQLRAQPGVKAYVFRKGKRAFAVAWSAEGSGALDLPADVSGGITVRSAAGSAVDGAVQGRTVYLKTSPLVLEGTAQSWLRTALSNELALRADGAVSLAGELGIACPPAQELRSPDQIAEVRSAAVEAYASTPAARTRIVSFLCRLERVADCAVLYQSLETPADDATARRALDTANHAVADLRAALVLKEGPRGWLPHARVLLRQVERRNSAALTAYKQQDYAVAAGRASQAASLAKSLVKLVAAEPVWDLSQVQQETASAWSNGQVSAHDSLNTGKEMLMSDAKSRCPN